MTLDERIGKAAAAIAAAKALFITAGAGIGVDSGLPDFRGNKGFWEAYPPIAKLGISFTGMANPTWFDQDPPLAWAFYGHRLQMYRRTAPHQGFSQLLFMARQKTAGYFVFTSNVDGQFQKAGFNEDRLVECHGSIHCLQCTRPCTEDIWDAETIDVAVDEERFRARDPLPLCIHCRAMARPNILMFGDGSWVSRRSDLQHERLNHWLTGIYQQKVPLAVIELGAGTAVATVRLTSESAARRLNATLVRINPRDDDVPSGGISIPLGAAEGAARLFEQMLAPGAQSFSQHT